MTRRYAVMVGALATSVQAAEPREEACPDGWFCDIPAEPQAPAPESRPDSGADAVPDAQPAPEPRARAAPAPDAMESWPEPPSHQQHAYMPSESRFAALGRVAFAVIENGRSPATPLMGSAGVGFRVRPLTHLAIDFGVDSAFGRDYLDATRFETALSGAVVAFLNPGEPVQVFLNTGLLHSWARVTPQRSHLRKFRYFGAFIGLGAEHSFYGHYAISLDFTGFIRGRSDGDLETQPEFVDQRTGRTTNASGGALLRAGILRYF